MQSKPRNALARLLRNQGIPVTTATNQLSFGTYTIVFDDAHDYATVYNPYSALVRLDIPYSTADYMLRKIRSYFSAAPGKSFSLPAHLSTNKATSCQS